MNSIIHARMEVKYAFKMEKLHFRITNKRTIQLHDHKYYFMISNSNSHLKTKLRPNSSTSYNIEHRRARQPLKEPRKQTYSMVSPSGEKPLSIISMWTTEACHISGVEKRTEKTLLLKLAAENQTWGLSQLSNSYTFFGHNAVAIFFFFSFSFNNTPLRYEEKTSKWPLNWMAIVPIPHSSFHLNSKKYFIVHFNATLQTKKKNNVMNGKTYKENRRTYAHEIC